MYLYKARDERGVTCEVYANDRDEAAEKMAHAFGVSPESLSKMKIFSVVEVSKNS